LSALARQLKLVGRIFDKRNFEVRARLSGYGKSVSATLLSSNSLLVTRKRKCLARVVDSFDFYKNFVTFRSQTFNIIAYVLSANVLNAPPFQVEKREYLLLGATPSLQAQLLRDSGRIRISLRLG
jgi:hypothetical protein